MYKRHGHGSQIEYSIQDALGDMIFSPVYDFKHMIVSHFPAEDCRLNLAENSIGEIIRWQCGALGFANS